MIAIADTNSRITVSSVLCISWITDSLDLNGEPHELIKRSCGVVSVVDAIIIRPNTLFFFFYKNVVFPTQAEYSYFSADFRLKIFLYYS